MEASRRLVIGVTAAVAALTFASGSHAAPPRVATESACKDVPEAESHLAVLMSPADVLAVYDIKANERLSDVTFAQGDGARIVLAARPFTTSAWLRQAIACHLARNAAPGKARPASSSPLDVEGVVVVVTSVPGELAVDITSSNGDRAREIRARARALVPRPVAQQPAPRAQPVPPQAANQ
jgi:hypothetical protein